MDTNTSSAQLIMDFKPWRLLINLVVLSRKDGELKVLVPQNSKLAYIAEILDEDSEYILQLESETDLSERCLVSITEANHSTHGLELGLRLVAPAEKESSTYDQLFA